MSDLGSRNYKTVSLIGFLMICGLFLVSTESWAGKKNCQSYEEQLSVSGLTPFGAFNGGASISFGGEIPEFAQATAVLRGSAENFDPANPGPIEIRRAGQLFFAPGMDGSVNVLTAVLRVKGVPTGPNTFAVSGRVRFTGGVGRFEHAHGKAKITGSSVIDLMTGQTQFDAVLTGKICNLDK